MDSWIAVGGWHGPGGPGGPDGPVKAPSVFPLLLRTSSTLLRAACRSKPVKTRAKVMMSCRMQLDCALCSFQSCSSCLGCKWVQPGATCLTLSNSI